MAVQAVAPALMITPAIISGIVIGVYEILLVHRDVTIATHRFAHSIHAVVIAIIAAFAAFSLPRIFVCTA